MKAIRALSALLILPSLTAFDVRPAASEIYRPWCAQYYSSSGKSYGRKLVTA